MKSDLWYYCSAVILLPLVAFLLKKRGFRRTERFLARLSKEPQPMLDEAIMARGQRAAGAVERAAKSGLYRAQRLEQAITLWWMLGLMRIESTVRLGIYRVDGEVQAHAWVLLGEEVILGQVKDQEHFEPLVDVNMNRPSSPDS